MESGLMAQAFSVPVAIITGGLGCIVAAGLVLKKFPQLIHYDGEEPEVSIRREVIPEGIGK
jgi:hypothetical protein